MIVLCVVFIIIATVIMLSVKSAVKMAFVDPYDKEYKRKTDKELYLFVAGSCLTAFLISIFSFSFIFIVTMLYWFYFTVFMIMFSRVWKFHEKKRWHLFVILIFTTVVSFFAAPFIREALLKLLQYYDIYGF